MAPSGLYARLCHAFLVLFFLMVDFLAVGLIFTKISGVVDRCKGLLTSFSFFDFSRDVAMATKVEKLAFFPDQSTLSLCHSETEWDNALYMQNIIASRMPL